MPVSKMRQDDLSFRRLLASSEDMFFILSMAVLGVRSALSSKIGRLCASSQTTRSQDLGIHAASLQQRACSCADDLLILSLPDP